MRLNARAEQLQFAPNRGVLALGDKPANFRITCPAGIQPHGERKAVSAFHPDLAIYRR
jgi:hypothetical protein